MAKYTIVSINSIIIQVALTTDVKGYTIGVIESMLPDENELTEAQAKKWTLENNKRMKAICKFLNENNL